MIPKKVVIKFRDYFTALYKNVLLGINTTPFYFEFYTLVSPLKGTSRFVRLSCYLRINSFRTFL